MVWRPLKERVKNIKKGPVLAGGVGVLFEVGSLVSFVIIKLPSCEICIARRLVSGQYVSTRHSRPTMEAPTISPDDHVKLDQWVNAKRARDYPTADQLRAELEAHGIKPDQARPSPYDAGKGGRGRGGGGGDWMSPMGGAGGGLGRGGGMMLPLPPGGIMGRSGGMALPLPPFGAYGRGGGAGPPPYFSSKGGKGGKGGGKPPPPNIDPTVGDWPCQSCGNWNWARRKDCNQCNSAKEGMMRVSGSAQGTKRDGLVCVSSLLSSLLGAIRATHHQRPSPPSTRGRARAALGARRAPPIPATARSAHCATPRGIGSGSRRGPCTARRGWRPPAGASQKVLPRFAALCFFARRRADSRSLTRRSRIGASGARWRRRRRRRSARPRRRSASTVTGQPVSASRRLDRYTTPGPGLAARAAERARVQNGMWGVYPGRAASLDLPKGHGGQGYYYRAAAHPDGGLSRARLAVFACAVLSCGFDDRPVVL